MKLIIMFVSMVLIFEIQGQSLFSLEQIGNYLPERVGKAGDLQSRALLFQPDREWMFDFDTEEPLHGIENKGGKISASSEWVMSGNSSLKWQAAEDDQLQLAVGLKLQGPGKGFTYASYVHLSLGIFIDELDISSGAPAITVELLGNTGNSLYQVKAYLHKKGWNILDVMPGLKPSTLVSSLRLTRGKKLTQTLFIDNAMIFICHKSSIGVGTKGILEPVVFGETTQNYQEPTADEKKAFDLIGERVIPKPKPIGSISPEKMKSFETWFASWNIESKGQFANGKFPLYYYRAVPGDLIQDSSTYFMYKENSEFCSTLKDLGSSYASVQDQPQKKRLGEMLVALVRLASTFGGMPNAWYNGRGFVEGVFYGREVLGEAGLLDSISRQVVMQYGVDSILAKEPVWTKPPVPQGEIFDPAKTEMYWNSTADDLNTGSKSTMTIFLLSPDTGEKSSNLKKLSKWYSRVAFAYAPNVNGTLKPDGSWFHHWGNRFDNYGWQGAFRGATDVLYWLSGTPFQIEQDAHERLAHMGEVYHQVIFSDGSYGLPDNFHLGGVPDSQKSLSEGFGGVYAHNITLNLARSGNPMGNESTSKYFAEKYLALNEVTHFTGNLELSTTWKASGLTKSPLVDNVVSLSYAGMMLRRVGDWSLSVTGISKNFYHTQYEREGFLFACIGGLQLIEKGTLHPMWQTMANTSLIGRHDPKMLWMTEGYHPSYSPCVTAIETDWKELGQKYYQKGSDTFVGGVKLGEHFGVFVQKFDARKNEPTYVQTVAKNLRFRKSYFIFDRKIMALGRLIGANAGERVTTGLLEERGENSIRFAHTADSWETLKKPTKSEHLAWAQIKDQSLGIWVFPGQTLRGETGKLSAGSRTGNMSRFYLDHGDDLSSERGSYSVVYIAKPLEDELQQFHQHMSSDKPPLVIEVDNPKVQMVVDSLSQTFAYVFWESTELKKGPLLAALTPCTLIISTKEKNKLELAVSDPDMRIERTDNNPFGYSLPTSIELTLEGEWLLPDSPTNAPSVKSITQEAGKTKIVLDVKDGLSTAMTLLKNE